MGTPRYTNKLNLPEPIVNAIINDPYNPGDADISTTRLINPPQIEALKVKYGSEIEEDVSERIWSLLGQSVHVVLERAAGGKGIAEKRYFAGMEGWKVSGAVDFLNAETLVDYKVTSVWTYIYGSRIKEWAAQGNVNRWLYFKNTGLVVTKLRNILILRDWRRKDAEKISGYPNVQVVMVELPVWTMEEAEAYVKERVLLHQAARKAADSELAPCSDEERWLDKNGKYNRCADFCPVNKFCQQLKRETNGNDKPFGRSNSSKIAGIQRYPSKGRGTGK